MFLAVQLVLGVGSLERSARGSCWRSDNREILGNAGQYNRIGSDLDAIAEVNSAENARSSADIHVVPENRSIALLIDANRQSTDKRDILANPVGGNRNAGWVGEVETAADIGRGGEIESVAALQTLINKPGRTADAHPASPRAEPEPCNRPELTMSTHQTNDTQRSKSVGVADLLGVNPTRSVGLKPVPLFSHKPDGNATLRGSRS